MTLEEKIANAERVLLYYKAYSDYKYAIIEYYARQGKPLKVVSYRVYGEELKSGNELRVYTPYLTSMNFSVIEDNFDTEKEAKLRMKELKEARKYGTSNSM